MDLRLVFLESRRMEIKTQMRKNLWMKSLWKEIKAAAGSDPTVATPVQRVL
jgi:hypothetical protein